ncbi:MAG: TIM barrel protein, partial [Tepidisphaeraceae bacterium]
KRAGRTADELAKLFDAFPEAQLCFDLGHAWQVDHTMTEGRQILRRFRDRIRQLHVSEVNTNSEHVPLTLTTVTAFRRLLDLLPDVPWILEAVTAPDKIGDEIQYVRESFLAAMDFVAD